MDMEIVVGTEDYEDLQLYFEHRKNSYYMECDNYLDRLWLEQNKEIVEEEENEEDKISNRCKAIRRILGILQDVSPNCEKPSVSKTEIKK